MKNFALLVMMMAAALWLPSSFAGSFSVSPIRADLSATSKSIALTLRNEGDEPVTVQADMFEWRQPQGEPELTASRDLVVSPALFELKPGERQVIRVILRKTPPTTQETTYRLLLQEVPKIGPKGTNELTVLLRISLPVFVLPANPVSPELTWGLQASEDQQTVLTARNSGGKHTRIFNILAKTQNGKALFSSKEPVYLLAGETTRWTLPVSRADLSGVVLTLEGNSEEGEIAANVAVSK